MPSPEETRLLRRRARLARGPRPHAHRARRAPHLHRRARVDPGRGGRRPARRGQRVSRRGRGHGSLPGRDRRRRARRGVAATRARGWAARFRASATRSTRSRTRARRASTRSPRRPGLLGPHLRRLRELAEVHASRPAASCRSTARAWPARRSPTSASRPRSCAVSRCWRAPRGCSATSRRRWSTRWGCLSTARWMSVRSTTRRLGSNGGGTATSEGRQAASTVPGGDAHAASPRALGPAECPCART